MRKSLPLLSMLILISLVAASQQDKQSKECRISAGIGFSGITQNLTSVGADGWLQLSYKLADNVFLATEFEIMHYKQPGYYKQLPVDPNEIDVTDNNFFLLLKYQLPLKSKIKVAAASGLTYTVRQSDYYIFLTNSDGISQTWFPNVSSFTNYKIPLLLEVEYPFSKAINIQARVKYNVSSEMASTYSTGIGLSLKL